MLKNIYLLAFITIQVIISNLYAQVQVIDSVFDQKNIALANTAITTEYLTSDEKEVILIMNLARQNGVEFITKIIIPYANKNEEGFTLGSRDIKTLINDLKSVKDLPPLLPQRQLFDIAKQHATRMGSHGLIGHDNYQQRFKNIKTANGENCSYGFNKPILIVLQLLIDKDVANKGHRKNILGLNGISKQFTHVGVAIKPHKVWTYNCVMDFAYIE